jgi:iron-sulfur cluster assembly protein
MALDTGPVLAKNTLPTRAKPDSVKPASCSIQFLEISGEFLMSVTVTEKAAKEVQRFISEGEYEDNAVLRIGVTGGGCSGFNYSLNIASDYDEVNATKTMQHGVAVVVDRKSALFLEGTTVDYYEGIEQRGFQFNNPNAKKTCGCGNSFSA